MTCSSLRSIALLTAPALLCLSLVSAIAWAQGTPPAGIITLKNGARIGPGIRGETATISKNSMQRGQGDTASNSIMFVDDDLRVTYVNRSRVDAANSLESVNTVPEEIDLPVRNEVSNGAGMFAIQQVLEVTQFNRHGRRLYSIATPRGRQDILQGITRITPLYAQVQTLRTHGAIAWDQRIATSTIPPQKLSEILRHELDLSRASEWMRLYRFYLQGERYTEARQVLLEAVKKFPELERQKGLLVGLDQALADQMFREIELRKRSGQAKLASTLLQNFPMAAGGGPVTETQLRVQSELDEFKAIVTQISEIVQSLNANMAQLPPADAEIVRPVVDEIVAEISIESASRLSDYERFRNDANMPLDQRMAFAIGGWLMGSGSGVDNFEVAKSAVRVSALVREYLGDASPARREEILELLAKEEAGRPELVGQIIARMKPPLPLPPAQPADQNAAQAEQPEGLLRVNVPLAGNNPAGESSVEYLIQLPPEYDPNRLYPCVVALPGLGNAPQMEIDWWCGAYDPERGERYGAATRYGYIVIAPKWTDGSQMQYNYSEAEHDRVLHCVRDAFRRCSIDTDRVFISGHFDGGAAAWDIALSHPDLWAGAIMLSPSAEKFILSYGINAAYVPTYSVWGEFDGSKFMENLGRTVDDYLRSPKYDAIGVEYKGRPRDHFLEELPRIIEWMELTSHRRQRAPAELDLITARPGDRFFYWVEIPEMDSKSVVSPVQFDASKRPKIEATLQPGGNTVRLSKFPGKEVWVWLRPDMVNFGQIVEVIGKNNSKTRANVVADNRTLLEDVRTRADRQAPFYARIVAH
ncbi:MAG: alpha/beta hydrolase-fold protein [Aureliella sp.]